MICAVVLICLAGLVGLVRLVLFDRCVVLCYGFSVDCQVWLF